MLQILHMGRTLLGEKLYCKLLKQTVYAQFMAGETDEEVLSKAEWFQKFGVHSIMAYTPGELHGTILRYKYLHRD